MKNIDSNITKIYLTEVNNYTHRTTNILNEEGTPPWVDDFLDKKAKKPVISPEQIGNGRPPEKSTPPTVSAEDTKVKVNAILNNVNYPVKDENKTKELYLLYRQLAGTETGVPKNFNNNFTQDNLQEIIRLIVRLGVNERGPYINKLYSIMFSEDSQRTLILGKLKNINSFNNINDNIKNVIYLGLLEKEKNISFDLKNYFDEKIAEKDNSDSDVKEESYTRMYMEVADATSPPNDDDRENESYMDGKIADIIIKIAEKEDGGDTVIDNILKDIENFTNAYVGDSERTDGGYGDEANTEAGMGLQDEVGGDEAPNTESEIEKLKAQIRELESVKRLMANGTTQGSDAFREYMSYLYKYGITNSQPQAITMTRDALKNNGVVIDDEIIKLKEKLEDLSSKQESSGESDTEPNSDDNDTNAAGGVPENDNNILNMLGSLPKLHPEEDGNDDGSEENNGDTEEGDLSNTLQNIPQIHDTEDEKSSEGDTTTQNSTLLDTLSGLPPLHSQEEEPRRQGLLNRLFGNPQ